MVSKGAAWTAIWRAWKSLAERKPWLGSILIWSPFALMSSITCSFVEDLNDWMSLSLKMLASKDSVADRKLEKCTVSTESYRHTFGVNLWLGFWSHCCVKIPRRKKLMIRLQEMPEKMEGNVNYNLSNGGENFLAISKRTKTWKEIIHRPSWRGSDLAQDYKGQAITWMQKSWQVTSYRF